MFPWSDAFSESFLFCIAYDRRSPRMVSDLSDSVLFSSGGFKVDLPVFGLTDFFLTLSWLSKKLFFPRAEIVR